LLANNVMTIAFSIGLITSASFFALGYLIALGKRFFDEMMR